jgi:WD40 repeat protein
LDGGSLGEDVNSKRRKIWICGLAVAALLLAPIQPVSAVSAQAAPNIAWMGGGTIGIQGTAVSPDGQIVATAAQDDTVKLWRVDDGSLIRTLTGHLGHVNSVAFTPDGQYLVSGGEFVFGCGGGGESVAAVEGCGNVKLWRVSDGAFIGDFSAPQSNLVYSVAISTDGTLLAAGYQVGWINIWRISDRQLMQTLVGDPGTPTSIPQVFSVAFSPDRQLLAAGTGSNTVRIFRVSDGALVRTLTGHTFFVASVAFSPDGTTLASGSWDQTVRLWQVTGLRLRRIVRAMDPVYSVAFSGDSLTLAVGAGDTVRLWGVSSGTRLRTLAAPSVSSITFIGSTSVVAGGFDSHVRIWRTSDGVLTAIAGHHAASIRSVTFAPNETLLASGSEDTTAKLWRVSDGADLQTLAEHIDVINAVAFSPDSQLVATAAGSPGIDNKETRIKIWRVGTAASLLTLPGHFDGSTGVAFSADGQILISSGRDDALRFWRVSDGALIRAVTQGNPIGVLAISPDRSIVAVPGRNLTINLYSAADGTLVRTLQATTGSVSSLSFSGDGKLLAAGEEAYGNNVQIFMVADGTVVRTLPGDPNGFVQGVAFAPDGTTLASGSGFSRTIQLWDPNTGTLRASYDQETGWGSFVHLPIVFAPSSTLFGYGRGDATVVMARNP